MAKPVIYSLDAMSYQVDNIIPFTYLGGTIKSSSIRVSEAVNNQQTFSFSLPKILLLSVIQSVKTAID